MKIGLFQMNCALGDSTANTDKIAQAIGEAAQAGCKLVVLPEMADTGYQRQAILDSASTWNDGPISETQRTAAKYGVWVVCGFSELVPSSDKKADEKSASNPSRSTILNQPADTRIFNSLAVISPEGTVTGMYRKTHLIDVPTMCESALFAPGATAELTEIEGFTVGLTICFDLRYPELYRTLAERGADVIINIAAWANVRGAHWQPLLRARAIENQLYVLGVNRVGTDDGVTFAGLSAAYDPFGEELCAADGVQEKLITLTLDKARIKSVRSELSVLHRGRPELYK